MDPLSDLLRVVRLDGAYFYTVEAAEPWSAETVAARELSPRIMPTAQHLISYHILTEGRCHGCIVGAQQVELVARHVIVFPHGDAEVMFIEVLRRYLDDLPPEQTGWLAGLRDEVVGRVLKLLHDRPSHPWTLAELAREAASSRSNLAKRFALLVGQPPMQYLTQWRMQVAANLLAQSGTKVAAIGEEVGYDSEAAFSRAFKKATGLAPGAWREVRRTAQS